MLISQYRQRLSKTIIILRYIKWYLMKELRGRIRDKLYRLSFLQRGLEDRTKILYVQYQRMMNDLHKMYGDLKKRCFSFSYNPTKDRSFKRVFDFNQFLLSEGKPSFSRRSQRLAATDDQVIGKRPNDFSPGRNGRLQHKQQKEGQPTHQRSIQYSNSQKEIDGISKQMISSSVQTAERQGDVHSPHHNHQKAPEKIHKFPATQQIGINTQELWQGKSNMQEGYIQAYISYNQRENSLSKPATHLNVTPLQIHDPTRQNNNPNVSRADGIGQQVNNSYGFTNPINFSTQSSSPNNQSLSRIPRAWRQYYPNNTNYMSASYNNYSPPYNYCLNQGHSTLQYLTPMYYANMYPNNGCWRQQGFLPNYSANNNAHWNYNQQLAYDMLQNGGQGYSINQMMQAQRGRIPRT